VLLASAVVIAGCGGGGTFSLNPVAAAADKTISAGGAKVTLSMTVTKNGQTITMPGSGVIDEQTGEGDITIDMSQVTSQMGNQATGTTMEEIYAGGVIYLKVPFSGLPAGKSWLKIDLSELARAAGVDAAKLQQQAGQSPTQAVHSLESAGKLQKLGTEDVNGVSTTHYRVTVDARKAFAHAKPWLKKLAQAGPAQSTNDVWVGSDELIHRMGFGFGPNATMRMDFTDFGTPVAVQAPPADQTIDAFKLLKHHG
jgi:hypothetical protein